MVEHFGSWFKKFAGSLQKCSNKKNSTLKAFFHMNDNNWLSFFITL